MKNLLSILCIAAVFASCSMPESGRKKEAANMARVQAFYDQVMNAHDAAMIDSFCHADFIDHNPDPGMTGKGSEELKVNFRKLFGAYPDLHVTTNFMVAQGDTIVSHVTLTGTNSGAMDAMPATNKQINMDGIDIIAVKDGKASHRWGFFDTMKMMVQLGLMPEPGAMPDTTKH